MNAGDGGLIALSVTEAERLLSAMECAEVGWPETWTAQDDALYARIAEWVQRHSEATP